MKDTIDYWDIKYKNCPVWGYIRFYVNESETTDYHPKISISINDILYLFKFISLPFRSKDTLVICIPDRKEIIDIVNLNFNDKKRIIFLRKENSKGNTFLIEGIRYIFRKLTYKIKHKDFNIIKNEVSSKNIEINENIENGLKFFIGDFYFNLFLKKIIRNKKTYYTNSIIPRVERHLNYINSTEIQHGVIYNGHLDYSNLPKDSIKNNMLVWNEFWFNKLKFECNFPGNIEIAQTYNTKLDKTHREHKIICFTTVSTDFSEKLSNVILLSKHSFIIKKHPRDYYTYNANLGEITKEYRNPSGYDAIVCHDTTLISIFVSNSLFFHYLILDSENKEIIKKNLLVKYNAKYDIDYKFIYKYTDIVLAN